MIFPRLFVNIAFEKLTNPQIKKLREKEVKVLQTAIQEDFYFKDITVKIYRWEGEKEGILLIHGWEAGNFFELIQTLKSKGHTIYAFDAPSHGYSSKGKTSLFDFTELVGILIQKFKVKKLISHSFGGVAVTYALSVNQKIEIDKYVLITTPDKFSERIDSVLNQYGIHPKVFSKLRQKLEADNNLKVKDLNVSEFVKKSKIKKALILHDKKDQIIPIQQSLNVHKNWKQSRFEVIENTGHFRILTDPISIQKVVSFIE